MHISIGLAKVICIPVSVQRYGKRHYCMALYPLYRHIAEKFSDVTVSAVLGFTKPLLCGRFHDVEPMPGLEMMPPGPLSKVQAL